MNTTTKLIDTSEVVGSGSKLETYWNSEGFKDFYKKFRKGSVLNINNRTVNDLERFLETYKIRSVGFGNYVTQEDRYNYISALLISFYDLNKVLGFNNNIGLNKTVSISFGARGSGSALAHFEPDTFIINITRYSKDTEISKDIRFAHTGGAGSVAHEYGHALDYYFGLFVDKSQLSALSGGIMTAKELNQASPIRKAMDDILNSLIWKVQFKETSAYYKRLEARFESDYWFRRNEIFARAFEMYIQFKLNKNKIQNTFLHSSKYDPSAYPTNGEMMNVEKKFDYLIKLFKQKLVVEKKRLEPPKTEKKPPTKKPENSELTLFKRKS